MIVRVQPTEPWDYSQLPNAAQDEIIRGMANWR